MSVLVFLHTAAPHVQAFDALLRELRPQVRARHLVRSDLLEQARALGVDSPAVRTAVERAVRDAGRLGGVVLCTCSTIGDLAESSARAVQARVLRVDRPMAEAAVDRGPRILVAAALDSTLAPTVELIEEVARERAAPVSVRTLTASGAWQCFEAGDMDAYHACIASALSRVQDVDVIVLAQASMAGVKQVLSTHVPVLASPELGLSGALDVLSDVTAQRSAP